jgi:hypothetical protein
MFKQYELMKYFFCKITITKFMWFKKFVMPIWNKSNLKESSIDFLKVTMMYIYTTLYVRFHNI